MAPERRRAARVVKSRLFAGFSRQNSKGSSLNPQLAQSQHQHQQQQQHQQQHRQQPAVRQNDLIVISYCIYCYILYICNFSVTQSPVVISLASSPPTPPPFMVVTFIFILVTTNAPWAPAPPTPSHLPSLPPTPPPRNHPLLYIPKRRVKAAVRVPRNIMRCGT